ncbi:MAG: hypothetical protein KDA32_00445 [Phycisphaerales bacterium]|nr:hypothetical protein [Phycisphaerales bacterium]
MLWVLAATWVLGAFDLNYTLGEARNPMFFESNPFAVHVIGSEAQATIYKAGMIGGATLILLCLRRHFLAEMAAWAGMAVHVLVGIRWAQYFAEVGGLQQGDWVLWAYATVGHGAGA